MCISADAVAEFVMDEQSVGEEAGSVSVCIDSGVTEGFQTDLTVTLEAADIKACELIFRIAKCSQANFSVILLLYFAIDEYLQQR